MASSGASSSASSSKPAPSARPSKLAKENNITAQEEAEIREAFSLFSEPLEGEKEGHPIGDLATFTAALDPDDEGFATYPAFVGVCALQLHARRQAGGEDYEEAHQAELDEAYALFAAGGDGDAPAITLADLKRVAALLRLDRPGEEGGVTEEVLRDMILEANGGAGVGAGVGKGEFDGVMRRAGVWR
ncbi:hypothetical protein NEMBOFW57_005202 [Staphylotrichum longicolle]|uniref:Calmodulin n=1 Tax=Staphylotrichum longicolle TaxID=669026 RepID=A0AAD4I197_9PEZI|nr:hypothetical protein NEMBOFW57_005202 [Staphylotrichum longicolle]